MIRKRNMNIHMVGDESPDGENSQSPEEIVFSPREAMSKHYAELEQVKN